MRPRLMFAEADFDPGRPEPVNATDLVRDLELATLWEGMARGDEALLAAARAAMLGAPLGPADIAYRQKALTDCLRDPSTVRALYDLAGEAIATDRKHFRGVVTRSPEPLLNRSVRVLEEFSVLLRRLRKLADGHADEFRSAAFTRLFETIRAELDDEYLHTVDAVLAELRFEQGIVVSARLGPGNKGVDFTLCPPPAKGHNRALRKSTLTCSVEGEEEHDFRAVAQLRGRALNDVADATAQSADHVRDFFLTLRDELGFYLGCVNLADTLSRNGMPVCWPEPHAPEEQRLTAQQLYEPCLALRLGHAVVANDLDADGHELIMITGPNQGGKSTFLRSLGIAHLMMRSGMFVTARQFTASTATAVFTHYTREEDASMTSGKLDEELARMSAIADHVTPGALLLCNESFAATNEREGSDIAAEIIRALTATGTRIVFVTHLYELVHRITPDRTLFLRATRHPNGDRTFTLTPGAPSPTAHGADLYTQIFSTPPHPQ